MKSTLSFAALLALSFVLLLSGCAEINNQNQTINKTVNEPVINETNTQNETGAQSMYDFCVSNGGQILRAYPAQCVLSPILYFNGTDNAINLFSCVSYFDGCNNCFVENGSVKGCTKKYCGEEDSGTPRCLEFNETLYERTAKYVSANLSCMDGVRLSVFFDNVMHTANLSVNGSDVELPQVISADGAKYSNLKITLFTKGNEAMVFDAKDETKFLYQNCTVE
jgi:membrane-bound inhibitor of C-type lysozyme